MTTSKQAKIALSVSIVLRIIVVAVVTACILVGCSIGTHTYTEGLDNRNINGAYSVSTQFLIADDFIENYEYVDGNFHHKFDEPRPFTNPVESTLLYFSYEDDIYDKAKNDVLSKYGVDGEGDWIIGTCGNYNFYVDENYKVANITHSLRFVACSYNDDINTLVFIGFYCWENKYELDGNKIVDFGDLLKTYFPWYDFESVEQ